MLKISSNIHHNTITIMGNYFSGGIYLLRVELAQPTDVIFGRHRNGTSIPLPRGEYLYIGSALSSRGANTLASRLLRHTTRCGTHPPHQIRPVLQTALAESGIPGKLPKKKTVRWHIDYLLELLDAEITGMLAFRTDQKLEKPLAEQLAGYPETQPVFPGLGASDHPGYTHLFHLDADKEWWDGVIQQWSEITKS